MHNEIIVEFLVDNYLAENSLKHQWVWVVFSWAWGKEEKENETSPRTTGRDNSFLWVQHSVLKTFRSTDVT